MVPNAYQKALKSYQKQADENLTPVQIVVELYKGMIRQIRDAKTCWQEGRLDTMSAHITKCFNILEALQANLDMEQGGQDAVFLNRFYSVIFSALSNATAKPDPLAEFDAIAAYVQQVHDRWYAMAYAKPDPVS